MGGKGPMLCVRNDQTDGPWHITQLADQLVTISTKYLLEAGMKEHVTPRALASQSPHLLAMH